MKLIIDVEKDYYEMLKYNVEHGQEYKPFEIIANGIPYNPSGDLISRSALLNQIDTTDWSDVRLLVEDAPTVEPKKPQGKWVLVHPLQENDEGAYMCSACRTGDWCISPEFKFCPYCGAEMDGGNAE